MLLKKALYTPSSARNSFFKACNRTNGPQGFGGSGVIGYLFSASCGALVVIFKNLRSKLNSLGDLGSPVKSKKKKKKKKRKLT